jgi:hypothetical protein
VELKYYLNRPLMGEEIEAKASVQERIVAFVLHFLLYCTIRD